MLHPSYIAFVLVALAAPAASAASPSAFLLLTPPTVQDGDAAAADVARVFVQVARSRIATTDGVTLRTPDDLPDKARSLASQGDLTKLDRPALVALRVVTGFDGVVTSEVRSQKDGLLLEVRFIDLANGRVLRVRRITGLLTAAVFAQIERDLDELAAAMRQTYRVTLHVASSPPGADVFIRSLAPTPKGGRAANIAACKTPCLRELTDGEYHVRVVKYGYRAFEHRGFYKTGDRVHLDAVLYNPIADRYLNRAPAWRLDSQALTVGYRYAFFNLARPALRELNLFTIDYLLRFGDFELGPSLRASGETGAATLLPTFAAGEPVRRVDNVRALAPMATFKVRALEKFSFLTLWAGVSAGFANLRTGPLAEWSFAGDVFAQVVSRVGRSKNFSFELVFDLGLTYAGQLPYVEKTISLFGDGPERTRLQPLLGFFAGIALRFAGWNDIF